MSSQETKIDPLTALYIDKTEMEKEADEKLALFFRYLLNHYLLKELMR